MKKILLTLMPFTLILIMLLSGCRFSETGVVSPWETAPYEKVVNYQVPFGYFDGNSDEFIKVYNDNYGRELLYWETSTAYIYQKPESPEYVYLICQPQEDCVAVYDNACFMYSKEKLSLDNEKIQSFMAENHWNEEVNESELALLYYNVEYENSTSMTSEENIEKAMQMAGLSFENKGYSSLITKGNKKIILVRETINENRTTNITQVYAYAIDESENIAYSEALTGNSEERLLKLKELKEAVDKDENIPVIIYKS